MSRRTIHWIAMATGVPLTYTCRFISADLEKPGAGRVIWRTNDYTEACMLWQSTIGTPYDQGKFTLSAEAIYEEVGSIPRPRKPDPNLDFWPEVRIDPESRNLVPAELPDASSGGPTDQGEAAPEGADGRGDHRVGGVDHDLAP